MYPLRRIAIVVGAAGLLAALAASLGAQQASTTVASNTPPLALAAPAIMQSGPVALRTIARGTILQAEDVGGEGAAAVLGFEAQRLITAGELLRAPAIAPAPVVRAGDSITIRVEMGGVIVTRPGTALGNARPGQPVRVRIGQSSLSGIAAAPGVVRLP
jgi:flagella basal body P-ring formation protein FlgA